MLTPKQETKKPTNNLERFALSANTINLSQDQLDRKSRHAPRHELGGHHTGQFGAAIPIYNTYEQ